MATASVKSQPEWQQIHIARLRNFENMGNVGKLAHKEANREKTANFWRRKEK